MKYCVVKHKPLDVACPYEEDCNGVLVEGISKMKDMNGNECYLVWTNNNECRLCNKMMHYGWFEKDEGDEELSDKGM